MTSLTLLRRFLKFDRESMALYLITWLMIGLVWLTVELIIPGINARALVITVSLGIFIDSYFRLRTQVIRQRIVSSP